ncbi:CRISPR-associated ring nuclease Csm6 [Pelomicrobium sp. P1]|uniref:CRISPR-associated ring nuclease Csm6 n=2 Tax=unclassified Pelomicrobium TaxID=2815318 RepID=UPI004056A30F
MSELDPMRPDRYPRRILLAVTGLSPQVVTETLYALAVRPEGRPAFVPTEVHLITTAEGAERARLTLLSKDPGWFHRLCLDYKLKGIAFDETRIHVLSWPEGGALEDIRTQEDNERVADFLTERIRQLTASEEVALHVSIAGGRKTMGYYAGYALSLYGRLQDRLSHVLVSTPYESNQEFYYPTPYSRVIYTHPPENRPIDARDAKVTLADIPFVRLRHELPRRLLAGAARFSEVVAAAQEMLGPPELVIDLDGRRIRAGGRIVPLPPADLAFLAWFARRAAEGREPLACPKDGVPEKEYAEAYLREYRTILGPMGGDEATVKRYAKGMSKDDFLERNSKLKKLLTRALDVSARPYLIHGEGKRPKRYRLKLPPKSIHFTAIDDTPSGFSPEAASRACRGQEAESARGTKSKRLARHERQTTTRRSG